MSETNQAAILAFIFLRCKAAPCIRVYPTAMQVVGAGWGCWFVRFFCYTKSKQQHYHINKFRCTDSSTFLSPGLTPPPEAQSHQMIPFLSFKKCNKTNCLADSEGQLQRRGSKNIWEMMSPEWMDCLPRSWREQPLDYTAFTVLSNQRQKQAVLIQLWGAAILPELPQNHPVKHLSRVSPNPIWTPDLAPSLPPPFMGDFCLLYCFLFCISLIFYFLLMKIIYNMQYLYLKR